MTMETYHGQVKTPQDAILLFEACRLGLLPRVQRRLSEKERQQIRSGSVFVWDEREAGMRRWTDGKSWSASRVSGSFLTYREMEGKRGSGFTNTAPRGKLASKSMDGSRTGDSDQDGEDGPDGYRYKPDGLMKQSFSITTSDGRHLHLISYFSRSAGNVSLKQPSTDVQLRNIRPQKGMYPEATVNEASSIPPVTRGPMTGSYSSAPPVGHPYPYPHAPQGYMPGYPPGTWPSSPANTPPAHYAPYPYGYHVPGYPPAPYPPHLAPPHYPPPPGPTQFDRAPPPPAQTNLPAPLHAANGNAPPPAPSYAPNSPPRVHTLPPYAQPTGAPSSLQPSPYSSSTIEARYDGAPQSQPPPGAGYPAQASNGAQNGYHQNYQKPPTPPASSAGVTPDEKPIQPEQVATRDVQTNNSPGTGTPTKMIPSINALINGDSQTNSTGANGEKVGSRAGSRSPAGGQPVAKELPDMMAQGGFQKGQHDLKRLDTQLFKF